MPEPKIKEGTRSVVQIGDRELWIDGYLLPNLEAIRKIPQKDDDVLIVVDGKERVGKSVMAQTLAWYLSSGEVTIDNITADPWEFFKMIDEVPPGTPLVMDEGYLGLASEDVMRKFNKILKKKLVTCGEKNLILIIVVPAFFDLSKYVTIHRADLLIHCYKANGKRGYFSAYDQKKMKSLYIQGKKFYNYSNVTPNFWGKYLNFYAVDEQEYKKKKTDTVNRFFQEDEDGTPKTQMYMRILACMVKILLDQNNYTHQELANRLGVHRSTVGRWLQRYNELDEDEKLKC